MNLKNQLIPEKKMKKIMENHEASKLIKSIEEYQKKKDSACCKQALSTFGATFCSDKKVPIEEYQKRRAKNGTDKIITN